MLVRRFQNTSCVAEIIPVAIGSWYFALDLAAPTELTPRAFFSRVRRCLESIDGVEDIAIDLMSLPWQDESVRLEPRSDARYGEYLGPHWDFESVAFSVRLPLDVQRQLLAPNRALTGVEATYFRVVMAYSWAMPVSCVALCNPAGAGETSQGAVAVFRHLERATERAPEGIRVKVVPPIFTHTDIFLHPETRKPELEPSFRLLSRHTTWNDELHIGFPEGPPMLSLPSCERSSIRLICSTRSSTWRRNAVIAGLRSMHLSTDSLRSIAEMALWARSCAF